VAEALGVRTTQVWVRAIESGGAYPAMAVAAHRRNLIRTRQYGFFRVLERFVREGDRVLEAGCGWAYSSFALAALGRRVAALDASQKLIGDLAALKEALGEPYRSNVELIAGDIFRLEALGRSFDVVFHDGTYPLFVHLEERRLILEQVRKTLGPGGRYAVTVPNLHNPCYGLAVEEKGLALERFSAYPPFLILSSIASNSGRCCARASVTANCDNS